MLEITANGTKLDLPADIAVSLTIENPFMLEDRVPTPYSLTFDLPPTARNLAAFGHPERLGTYAPGQKNDRSATCTIRFQAVNVATGMLLLARFDKNLKVKFSGLDFNDQLKQKLPEADLGREDIPGASEIPDYASPTNYAYQYRQWAKSKINGTDPRLVIAPVFRTNSGLPFRWADKKTNGGSALATKRSIKKTLQDYYYNAFNPATQDFCFTGDGDWPYHAEIFPQFRVGYLIGSCMGEKLPENPFAAAPFHNLVVPSYYFPAFHWTLGTQPMVSNLHPSAGQGFHGPGGISLYPNAPHYINLREFMPDLNFNVFLREILRLFCMTLCPRGGTYAILPNTEILASQPSKNWSQKLVDDIAVDYREARAYAFGYSQEEKAYTGKSPLPDDVATINDMVTSSTPLNTDSQYAKIYYIRETRQYFEKKAHLYSYEANGSAVSEKVVEYTFLGRKPEEPTEGPAPENKFDATSNIVRTHLFPVNYFTSLNNLGGEKYHMAVPVHEQPERGEYFRPILRESTFELLCYAGMKPVANAPAGAPLYPLLSPYGNDDLSLQWEGDNGLMEAHHRPFRQWIERDKLQVSGAFLLSAADLHQLDITEKVHVNGRNFFIEKIQITLRAGSIDPAAVDLVEA